MEQKTPEETSQNEREKTRESTTHTHLHSIYDYDNPRRRRKRQPIPQETLSDLDKLRFEYRDKIIEKRSFESSILGYCEYDVYPDEYYEKELEILCGDMDPEQAANYLESVSLYSHALLKRLDTVRAFQYLKALGSDRPETREYAERVIAENPGTPIELEARFYIADVLPWSKDSYAEKAQAYREILGITPNSINILSPLGHVLVNDDKPVEAIQYFKQVNRMNPEAENWGLGEAYEKLGDVKTAWTYYKKALRGRAYHSPIATGSRLHIEAIEAGDPIYKPIPQETYVSVSSVPSHEHTLEHHGPQEHKHHAEVFPDDPPWEESESTSLQETQDDNDERRRAAAEAAQRAHDDFLKHQEPSQKELNDFLQWAETIMNADSPMDTNDFLMQEMEAHLKGGQAQFDPDRIVRAFETMERYGPAEGIKRLQKADPDLAKQVQRLGTHNKTQHVHLHTHGDQHREQPHLTTDVADQRNLLRQHYKDKGLVRTWGTSKFSVGWGVYPDEYYETELELLCG